jgi:hypothetical protein
MMWADFDTEANALEIRLRRRLEPVDYSEEIDEPCHVAIVGDVPVNIGLLDPVDHLDLLGVVAERYDLDAEELLATAQAALAAPDHLVEVSIGKSLVA